MSDKLIWRLAERTIVDGKSRQAPRFLPLPNFVGSCRRQDAHYRRGHCSRARLHARRRGKPLQQRLRFSKSRRLSQS